MANGMQTVFGGGNYSRRPVFTKAPTEQIFRYNPVHLGERLIARHELRVYFEPDWNAARYLAARFPYCLVFSIPPESNTSNLTKTPGWRMKRLGSASL